MRPDSGFIQRLVIDSLVAGLIRDGVELGDVADQVRAWYADLDAETPRAVTFTKTIIARLERVRDAHLVGDDAGTYWALAMLAQFLRALPPSL